MSRRSISTVVALGAGLAIAGCASASGEDTSSQQADEDVADLSEAVQHRGGGDHRGGGHPGGGDHHGGGRPGGGHHGGGGWGGGGHGGGQHHGGFHRGGHRGPLHRGHYGYGRGGAIIVGDPIYVGVPQQYVGWIRDTELEQYCIQDNWDDVECSFTTEAAVCIPNVGCFVRPY